MTSNLCKGIFVAAAFSVLIGCAANGAHGSAGHGNNSQIQASLIQAWTAAHPNATAVPMITVSDSIVSLTGTVSSEKDRIDAVREAWQPDGVIEVVNELHVPDSPGKTSRRDRATTIKLRTRLTFDTDVASTHYSIETLDGTVYLMGKAHDEAELARVKQLAEQTVGKGKVVSYVEIKPIS